MVSEALRALLQRGEGVGDIEGANTGAAEHPVCGDRVQLSVLVEDGVVRRVCWRASGCPASMAVAALCSEVLVDVPVDKENVATTLVAAHEVLHVCLGGAIEASLEFAGLLAFLYPPLKEGDRAVGMLDAGTVGGNILGRVFGLHLQAAVEAKCEIGFSLPLFPVSFPVLSQLSSFCFVTFYFIFFFLLHQTNRCPACVRARVVACSLRLSSSWRSSFLPELQ